jgi:predicted DNA-binding transcriptional regulator YafY
VNPREIVTIDYTNWKGERSTRRIHPLRIAFENNEWHHDTQWLLEAVDLTKGQVRTFAMGNIHSWEAALKGD